MNNPINGWDIQASFSLIGSDCCLLKTIQWINVLMSQDQAHGLARIYLLSGQAVQSEDLLKMVNLIFTVINSFFIIIIQ